MTHKVVSIWFLFVLYIALSGAFKVTFSEPRGWKDAGFLLTLSCPEIPNAIITYTSNPSGVALGPSLATGTQYTQPLPIGQTVTVQALCFSSDGATQSTLEANTYIYISDIISNPNMNTAITQNPTWGPLMPSALRMPTAVFSYIGALANDKVQHAGVLEFWEEDGTGFSEPTHFNIYGGYSATFDRTSIRAHIDNELDYDLYKNYYLGGMPPITKFENLNFRASQDAYGYFANPTFIRNWFTDTVVKRMGNWAPNGRYVQLYNNGIYWGVYHMREIFNDGHTFQNYWGGDNSKWSLQNYGSTPTDPYWDNAQSETASHDWSRAKAVINMESYINYVLVELWTGNLDWGGHNWQAGGPIPSTPRKGYHYFASDMDYNFYDVTNTNLGVIPPIFWADLVQIPDFQMLFSDMYYKQILKPSGVLHPANSVPLWNMMYDSIKDKIIADNARWGTPPGKTAWTIENSRAKAADIANNFMPTRTQYLLPAIGFYSPVAPPTPSVSGGRLDSYPQITLDSGGAPVYYTLDGTDPRLDGGGLNPNAIAYAAAISLNLPITTLRARTAANGQWSPLQEETYIINGQPCWLCGKVVISEIMYSPQKKEGKWLELKNIGSDTIDLNGAYLSPLYYKFPPHTILAPGQFFVVGYDVVDFKTLHGVDFSDKFFGILKDKVTLFLYDATDRMVFQAYWETKYPYPEAANDLGNSLILKNYATQTPITASDWTSSVNAGGSPFADEPAGTQTSITIAINEVYFTAQNSSDNWVELFNTDPVNSINVDHWRLTNTTDKPKTYTVKTITIPPLGYGVINGYNFNLDFESSIYVFSIYNSPLSTSTLTGLFSGIKLGPCPPGTSYGPYASANGGAFYNLPLLPTQGQTNEPYVSFFYVSEIPVQIIDFPINYIKMTSRSGTDLDLSNWRIQGSISFFFPAGFTAPSGADVYILAPNSDSTALRLHLQLDPATIIIGPYQGDLSTAPHPVEIQITQPVENYDVITDRFTFPGIQNSNGSQSLMVYERLVPVLFGEETTSWQNDVLSIYIPPPPPPPEPTPLPVSPVNAPVDSSTGASSGSSTGASSGSSTGASSGSPTGTPSDTPTTPSDTPTTPSDTPTTPSDTPSVNPPTDTPTNSTDSQATADGFIPGMSLGASIGIIVAIVVVVVIVIIVLVVILTKQAVIEVV